MGAQTSYSNSMARGFAGLVADDGPTDFWGRSNGNASADIPFGTAVILGATDNTVKTPGAVTDKVVGICAHSMAYQPGAQLGTSGVARYAAVNAMRKGRILLTAEENVVPGDRLWTRAVAGAGGAVLGAFRKSAVAGETIDTSANLLVVTTAVAGSLFVCEVDFTVNVSAQVTAAFSSFRAALSAAVLAADSSGTVATFESTLITAINAITLP
jgi:hypothetical protein